MDSILIAKYGEIFLKGLNRPYFEKTLLNNIRNALSDLSGVNIRKEVGRFYITSEKLSVRIYMTKLIHILSKNCHSVKSRRKPLTEKYGEKSVAVIEMGVN